MITWIWAVSIVLLVASFIFVYKILASSYEYYPSEKKSWFFNLRGKTASGKQYRKVIQELNKKIMSLEESMGSYQGLFSEFRQQLRLMEQQKGNIRQNQELENVSVNVVAGFDGDEEDWKEMYYEENELREKLENTLDLTQQKLEEANSALLGIESLKEENAILHIEKKSHLARIAAFEETVIRLQKIIDNNELRDREIHGLIAQQTVLNNKLKVLESENSHLQAQNGALQTHLQGVENTQKEHAALQKKSRELESRMAVFSDHKKKNWSGVESLIKENRMFF